MEQNKDLIYPWKVKWDERAKHVSKFIPADTSVIDLGGGLGEFHKNLKGQCYYLSLDIEKWTEYTQKCDFNKDELPQFPPFQFIICLGLIEYIENPKDFLSKIKMYSNKLLITYRKNSNGGMERKNSLDYSVFELFLKQAGWEVMFRQRLHNGDRFYFCNRND